MKFRVRAPSNIALIKYMGKKTSVPFAGRNIPENPSLSMTLNALSTYLEIELSFDGRDQFRLDPSAPEIPAGILKGARIFPVELKPPGVDKFERHYRRVQSRIGETLDALGHGPLRRERPSVVVRSFNTFPAGSGIASSASSFAALTLAAALANAQDPATLAGVFGSEKGSLLRRALARISREGSGSSCRSFEGPWVQWDGEDASACSSRLPDMAHFVVVVSSGEKAVSSSDAHQRVKSSPLWEGRAERAGERFARARLAIESGDRAGLAKLAWNEMWEMHSLFHTAQEPFSYWNPGTIDGLHYFGAFLREEEPPIVTLDAGPNIHVIVPGQERDPWRDRLLARFGKEHLLEDSQGRGAEILS